MSALANTMRQLSGRLALLRAALESSDAALREIAEQDPVEMALDPTWAKRIASAALAKRQQEKS
ncbi:hypothetical protein [Burkholderia pseudomallei]|uniref:hypothetical protein n=1 Tax=Burkholderia pseudomallei TaxID=28450 RepID=UPI00100AEE85|nr:hypothetical protein [Burkholderia pseudomallei]